MNCSIVFVLFIYLPTYTVYGILVSQPGIKPTLLVLKIQVLTTGPLRRSWKVVFM